MNTGERALEDEEAAIEITTTPGEPTGRRWRAAFHR